MFKLKKHRNCDFQRRNCFSKNGSALVFSLIVLSAMLLIAVGTSSVAVVKKKDASATQFSVQAYQNADSGALLALKKVKLAVAAGKKVGQIVFEDTSVTCDGGAFKNIKDLGNDKVFNVIFQKKDSSDPTNPNKIAPVTCDDFANVVTDIKTTGIYGDTARAVGIGVGSSSPSAAAFTCTGSTLIDPKWNPGIYVYPGDNIDLTGATNDVEYVYNTTDNSLIKCEFACVSGYSWSGLSCENFFCIGNPPPQNSFFYPEDNIGLTVDTDYGYSENNTDAKCEYKCVDYYTWKPLEKICEKNVCLGSIPANASLFNADDEKLSKSVPYAYSASDTAVRCQYNCNSYFKWTDASCEPNVCTGNIPQNASFFSGDDVDLLSDTQYAYSSNNTTEKCQYNCKNGYIWNGNSCVLIFNCGTTTVSGSAGDPNVYGTVVGEDGRCWLDRNLGATQAAISPNDVDSYGYFYQWGRGNDGHQIPTSALTSILSDADVPGHGYFIVDSDYDYDGNADWRTTPNNNLWQGVAGINNPCPAGFRIPTQPEWNQLANNFSQQDYVGAFYSNLKLPIAGLHYFDGSLAYGVGGVYWSSNVIGIYGLYLGFSDGFIDSNSGFYRAAGLSVRCIKD